MPRKITVLLALPLACSASLADDSCTSLLAQIDAKIRAGGVTSFTLVTLDNAAETRGRVVGSCGQGSKKIVYARAGGVSAAPAGPAASATPARRARPPAPDPDSDLLTECKDGSMSVGGQCRFSPPPPPAR